MEEIKKTINQINKKVYNKNVFEIQETDRVMAMRELDRECYDDHEIDEEQLTRDEKEDLI